MKIWRSAISLWNKCLFQQCRAKLKEGQFSEITHTAIVRCMANIR